MLNPMLSNITTKNENILSLITKKEIMINGLKKKMVEGQNKTERTLQCLHLFIVSGTKIMKIS